MNTLRLLVALCGLFVLPAVQAADDLKAFPAAEQGMVRHVLQLPPQGEEEEADLKIELVVGRTLEVDAHNRYFFSGQIAKETISGWGFPRFIVSPLGPLAGTLMAIDADTPKVRRFVALGGEPYLMRYNSRLPIVVYAPEGVEVRYRLWRASPGTRVIDRE
ncbi:ecotin family protein [Candidatus Accumulibacter sp. ACC007]|uniref:ecotin n=1 Tax=Candidatus Accumulibacter sp. ACC007 TaxID=2823333 RepID=UPI0025C0233C|nr:ecotin family protein [Candidatus Accumulibacter sp. ACC007]